MDLDDAYANAAYIPGADDFIARWTRDAQAYRDALGARAVLGVPYGPSERQAYDLFLPDAAPVGLCVFVHGGYWLRFDRSYWSHFADGMRARGWAVAMPSYDLCPDVTIAEITQQVARAIEVISDRVDGPLVLAGHSAGGHLVSRMCVPGMLPEAVMARLRHVMAISPVSDLRPLLRTSMNTQFGMDIEAATAESPALMTPMDVPVTVWVGADERPVFLDQAQWLAEAWGADHVVATAKHHFDVIDPLTDPQSDMVKRLINL